MYKYTVSWNKYLHGCLRYSLVKAHPGWFSKCAKVGGYFLQEQQKNWLNERVRYFIVVYRSIIPNTYTNQLPAGRARQIITDVFQLNFVGLA